MTVYKYQVSIGLLLVAVMVVSVTMAAATYFWASKTVPFSVNEPLVVTNYPTIISTHPGENTTLDITIMNSAAVDYQVMLTFILNDTTYQQSYVEFSHYTYSVVNGPNQIQAWFQVDRKAPPTSLELRIEFLRE